MAGGTHLRLEERERVAALKAEGLSLRGIARALGRAASTISRELRRNALPKGGYLPVHAEGCYLERRQRPAVLERDAKLGRFVRERLLEGWTPEQVAGWLKRGEERGLRPVSLETIYAFVHRPGQRGEKLWKLLPRGRARRGRRRGRRPRSTIAGRRSIHDRPADVQERKDPGHWEGDLLICRRTRPVLVLEERKTRFVLAARLAGKSAAETVAVLMVVFRRLDPRLRSSITFDNDTAFARHALLASACAMTTWFCDAYASWQNDRVRRQACFQAVLVRSMALSVTTSLRMQAVSASFEGFPAWRSRSWKPAIAGLAPRAAATAAMYRHARNAALPPQIARLPRILPLSRLNGATPTRAAACRRVSEPSSGSSARSVRALTGPTPGTERSSSSLARQSGLSRTAPSRSRSIASSASSSQRRWASIPSCRAGSAAWRRSRSATSISSSCRRRATRAPRWRVALSGKGRTGGSTTPESGAIVAASRRSVFASRPVARANARTRRGLTTATGSPAAARAAARRTSSPPVASSTTSVGARAARRSTSAATPSSSWPIVKLSPEGREWMSSRRLETSMPTKVGALSMTRFR